MMKVNVEGLVANCGARRGWDFGLNELVENLKRLRAMAANGDGEAGLDNFFDLYRFRDNETKENWRDFEKDE